MTGGLETAMPLLAGLAGAGTAALVARASLAPYPLRRGWKLVRPGSMHWTGLILGAGLVALCLYVRIFVGSARSDAEVQMRWLTLIIAGFALCIAVCSWQVRAILRAGVRWRGDVVAWNGPEGRDISRKLDEVVAMRRRWNGSAEILFSDGEVLKLDPYATTVPDLWNRIVDINER